MAVKNSTILEKAWIEGSNDFQQRIPDPSVSGYDATISALFDPMNGQLINEFANLVVGLMATYVHTKRFDNPLRALKKPAAQFGNTERNVAVNYLKAHSYKVDDETLLKLEKPEYKEWFYSVNMHRRYEFSWSRYELKRVFNSGDSNGFEQLFIATLDAQRNSDEYDEMDSMIQVFAEANDLLKLHTNYLGKQFQSGDMAFMQGGGQMLLKQIRADAGRMRFPSMLYNNIDIPTFDKPENLVLWVTPEIDAAIDVYALAPIFNIDKAEVNFRKIVIPDFPIPNVVAALTSDDFVYCRDVYYGVEPPFYNPANRTYKYYLFHDQMIGVNPLANCVLYKAEAAPTTNPIKTVKAEPETFEFSPATGTIPVGGTLQLNLVLDSHTLPESDKIDIEPDAAIYSIVGAKRGETVVPLNSRTYIDNNGVLHLQKTDVQDGDVITVKAVSSYINPSADMGNRFEATFAATVEGVVENSGKVD